ncbi:MAG: hypothetical protein V1760_02535 [Candidatus Peregrinibacteria bacterium]
MAEATQPNAQPEYSSAFNDTYSEAELIGELVRAAEGTRKAIGKGGKPVDVSPQARAFDEFKKTPEASELLAHLDQVWKTTRPEVKSLLTHGNLQSQKALDDYGQLVLMSPEEQRKRLGEMSEEEKRLLLTLIQKDRASYIAKTRRPDPELEKEWFGDFVQDPEDTDLGSNPLDVGRWSV